MKNYIARLIKSVILLLISTALCTGLYEWSHLDKVFGPKISFEKWMAIIAIVQLLFPTRELFKKDDNQGS
jgi:hypothetical protein